MTKIETDRLFKCDLARYLKSDFAEYRKIANLANNAYHKACIREGTNKPKNTSEWDALKDRKNDLQHKIERKLPKPDLFKSVYSYFVKLLKTKKLDIPITDEIVLKLVNGEKPNNVGKLKPIGTEFTSIKSGITYKICDIKDGKIIYSQKDTNTYKICDIGLFQNALKNGRIHYNWGISAEEL